MSSISFLTNPQIPLIIDTSVVININATKCGNKILSAFPHQCLITANVFSELEIGMKKGYTDYLMVQELIKDKTFQLSQLGDKGSETYLRLIDGNAKTTLDDGEAATIALADEISGVAVIDEKKARMLCSDLFPNLEIVSTVELLTSELIKKLLGADGCADALMYAFIDARMRVSLARPLSCEK